MTKSMMKSLASIVKSNSRTSLFKRSYMACKDYISSDDEHVTTGQETEEGPWPNPLIRAKSSENDRNHNSDVIFNINSRMEIKNHTRKCAHPSLEIIDDRVVSALPVSDCENDNLTINRNKTRTDLDSTTICCCYCKTCSCQFDPSDCPMRCIGCFRSDSIITVGHSDVGLDCLDHEVYL